MYSNRRSSDEIRNKRTVLNIITVFSLFFIFAVVTGIISYRLAANVLKNQFIHNCAALSFTVAAIIETDSDGYEEFLNTLNTESDYYKRIKALMMRITHANANRVSNIFTETRVNDDTIMFIIGCEDPSCPANTEPGFTGKLTPSGRKAYDSENLIMGTSFENSVFGAGLSAYAPIVHSRTGEFLGLAGANVSKTQYNNLMDVFLVQAIISFMFGFILFGMTLRLFSVNILRTINTDSLTKLANKSFFKSDLKRRIASSMVNYVIMADIDHFKLVNDTYGHEFGDKVLILIADQIAGCTRTEDCAARYGGEEFVICLSKVSETHVTEIMERIRFQIEQMRIFNEETSQDISITISLGAVKLPDDVNVSTAVNLADKALYVAKRTRNTCVLL